MATLLTRSGRKLGWRIHGFYKHCFFRCLAVGQSSNASVDNTSRHEVHIFAAKKARDILRAIFVLKLCSYDVFVRNNMWVCKVAYKGHIYFVDRNFNSKVTCDRNLVSFDRNLIVTCDRNLVTCDGDLGRLGEGSL